MSKSTNQVSTSWISDRSTQMATSLIQDIGSFCNKQGSSILTCSLDAEGAYDAVPHSVLLDCAGALPNHCWSIMYNWYSHLKTHIKRGNNISAPVSILRGISQGGLTSSALFNMFYQTLINKLCESNLGVIINNRKYNTLCYTDDVILMSTTVTGLQSLITHKKTE